MIFHRAMTRTSTTKSEEEAFRRHGCLSREGDSAGPASCRSSCRMAAAGGGARNLVYVRTLYGRNGHPFGKTYELRLRQRLGSGPPFQWHHGASSASGRLERGFSADEEVCRPKRFVHGLSIFPFDEASPDSIRVWIRPSLYGCGFRALAGVALDVGRPLGAHPLKDLPVFLDRRRRISCASRPGPSFRSAGAGRGPGSDAIPRAAAWRTRGPNSQSLDFLSVFEHI